LYNKENNSVDYIETISSESDYIKSLTPYAGMSSKEYELFFRKNRLKTKGLPIYKSKDSKLKIQMKNTYTLLVGEVCL